MCQYGIEMLAEFGVFIERGHAEILTSKRKLQAQRLFRRQRLPAYQYRHAAFLCHGNDTESLRDRRAYQQSHFVGQSAGNWYAAFFHKKSLTIEPVKTD